MATTEITLDEADAQITLHDDGDCGICNADEIKGECLAAARLLGIDVTFLNNDLGIDA